MALVGAIGFLYYWFVGMKTVFSCAINSWKNKRGMFWILGTDKASCKKLDNTILKAALFWLIPGWPIVLVLTNLASVDAVNALIGTR